MRPNELRDALDAAFPRRWRDILHQRVPFYRFLSEQEQERFEDKVQHFVLTKSFSSRKLDVTDEMRVVTAAAACRLTLNLSWIDYASLRNVELRADEAWDHNGQRVSGLGDQHGVTLSWPSLVRSMATSDDGYNVGFHEFAHALDCGGDGGDHRPHTALYTVWTDVIGQARADVLAAIRAGVATISEYATTNDRELFAVATEWFFERPHDLDARLPALFELLKNFYRQDPAGRRALTSIDAAR